MARTQYVDTPDELKNQKRSAFEQRDRYLLGVTQGHKRLPSKAQKRLLKRTAIVNSPMEGRGSLFKYLSPTWRALNTTQKNAWSDAGSASNLTNWQCFVSDNAARIRNSLPENQPPSTIWQVRAGYLKIEAPASEIILRQDHPQSYVVSQKVPGASWKNELVTITETFSLPLSLSISYKSSLTAHGSTQSARYFARVWTSYQGEDIYTDFSINFTPSTDWIQGSVSTSGLRGIIIGYTLYMEILGYRGELFFDNIKATHSGQNWARDPRCDNISKTFKNAFAIVPPFWVPVSLPTGASFSSVFPPAV